jgi:hypothetical protein
MLREDLCEMKTRKEIPERLSPSCTSGHKSSSPSATCQAFI